MKGGKPSGRGKQQVQRPWGVNAHFKFAEQQNAYVPGAQGVEEEKVGNPLGLVGPDSVRMHRPGESRCRWHHSPLPTLAFTISARKPLRTAQNKGSRDG